MRHCWLAIGWFGSPSVGCRLGLIGVGWAPTDPNRHPTDAGLLVSTLAPHILRVLNPFLALVRPKSNIWGGESSLKTKR